MGLRFSIAIVLLLTCGCSTSLKNMKDVETAYGQERLGLLSDFELVDGDKRLEIFVEVEHGKVLWCIAENPEKKALRYIAKLLKQHPPDRHIGVYAHEIVGFYKFWFGGPDLSIKVVGLWHVKARKHIYLNPLYGTSWREWLNMKSVLKKALEAGVEVGKEAAPIP